jgi:hypothetical protein
VNLPLFTENSQSVSNKTSFFVSDQQLSDSIVFRPNLPAFSRGCHPVNASYTLGVAEHPTAT